jgi:hypothetical protein
MGYFGLIPCRPRMDEHHAIYVRAETKDHDQ